ncbi:ABC transporter thiamine pyrophosphate-binding lipoprotein p37/Cypl [Mycoplasma putrefaciens]|uniref:ABC transporter, substrate-binding protein n=1 Tax=Mycoplasma putrefaciens (strain ATCC 15718 / NCTC 10155 / C30 KS-1 / KS-1) TaxID=743965 RepID=A0A7U3ZSL1_MYCPK|nr:ABC transporter substrate-binding protein [Mycoplasma putrefaciens]AEM68771.1 ABC transporter, substrate-binding protein [Mycoplasma putrefaciens KS1]
MNKNNLKIMITMSVAVGVGSTLTLVSACNTRFAPSWDDTITITNGWINPGFSGTEKEEDFIKLLENKFNGLKNQNKATRKYKDVKFQIKGDGDKKAFLENLKANDKKNNVYIANYTYYKNFWDSANQKINHREVDQVKLVAQTSTLKFKWQSNFNDNDFYKKDNGQTLMQQAEANNKIWVDDVGAEYPDWYKQEKEQKLNFDGSKYTNFYDQNNKLTYVYRGAILISGNKTNREKIKSQWEKKEYENFIKNGIVYEKSTSAGQYSYQVALMARHFGKSVETVKHDLEVNESYKKYIFKGKGNGPDAQLGKKAKLDSQDFYPSIGFVDDGVYNWTHSTEKSTLFKPTEFKSEKGIKDDNNVVIRTLILTNPAPYDLVLARKGMLDEQVKLLTETLTSLSVEQNTYGIYTGYNKFNTLDKTLLEKMVKLQVQAETTQDLATDIPDANKK